MIATVAGRVLKRGVVFFDFRVYGSDLKFAVQKKSGFVYHYDSGAFICEAPRPVRGFGPEIALRDVVDRVGPARFYEQLKRMPILNR